jgi:hypothetical protein
MLAMCGLVVVRKRMAARARLRERSLCLSRVGIVAAGAGVARGLWMTGRHRLMTLATGRIAGLRGCMRVVTGGALLMRRDVRFAEHDLVSMARATRFDLGGREGMRLMTTGAALVAGRQCMRLVVATLTATGRLLSGAVRLVTGQAVIAVGADNTGMPIVVRQMTCEAIDLCDRRFVVGSMARGAVGGRMHMHVAQLALRIFVTAEAVPWLGVDFFSKGMAGAALSNSPERAHRLGTEAVAHV